VDGLAEIRLPPEAMTKGRLVLLGKLSVRGVAGAPNKATAY
jgi:hypothetical protein